MKIFDAHFHIIDKHFPITENNGYLPPKFSVKDYLNKTKTLNISGGCVVSGSFNAFDQTYIIDALNKLGPNFVGITQLPAEIKEDEILRLNKLGIRGIRFNIKRGGSESVNKLEYFAKKVFEIASWHIELYIDSTGLDKIYNTLIKLPKFSIDHLGLSKCGFKTLLKLVEKNAYIKATGFGRIDFDPIRAMKEIYSINQNALIFGTDLPSTRAKRPFSSEDIKLILNAFDEIEARKILHDNAINFYKPKSKI